MDEMARRWVVVGGGRWGRTLAMMLGRALPAHETIEIVTRHTADQTLSWLSQLPSDQRARTQIGDDLEHALAQPGTCAVIVANRTALHAATAAQALVAGKHVLVEKPFALDLAEARALVQDANDRNLVFCAGLEYLFASYLHHLRRLCEPERIQQIEVDWFDPVVEHRHGGEKRADPQTSILHDILPHVWSVFQVLSLSEPARPRALTVRGTQVELALTIAGTEAVVRMNRYAERRARVIALHLADGSALSLDFTREPGRAVRNGVTLEECPDWTRTPSPVGSELKAFREAILDGSSPIHAAARCIDSVRLPLEAETMTSRTALQAC